MKDEGLIIPVVVTIFADRSYTFITKTPPASVLLKKTANLAKGSAEPNRNKVGTVTAKQVEDIARQKLQDLNIDRTGVRDQDGARHRPVDGHRRRRLAPAQEVCESTNSPVRTDVIAQIGTRSSVRKFVNP